MKVFVAGASGAMGRPLVRRLLAAGHEVTGMTRREERAAAIREAGANAVVCDVFDAPALQSAVVEAAPEAVVHQLTSLPPRLDYKAKDDPLAATTACAARGRATFSLRRGPPEPAAWWPRASPSSTHRKATGSRTRRRRSSTVRRLPSAGRSRPSPTSSDR